MRFFHDLSLDESLEESKPKSLKIHSLYEKGAFIKNPNLGLHILFI